MPYFASLPKILYSTSNEDTNFRVCVNILAKSQFIAEVVKNTSLYYPYDIQEGEKPEDVANKFYNNPQKHWIILLANNISDPQYDWPLETRVFDNYIKAKYSSINVKLNPKEYGNFEVGETVYQGSSIDNSSATGIVAAYDSTNKIIQIKFPSEVFANNATLNSITGANTAQTHSIISLTSNDDGYSWASNTTYQYVITETKYNNLDEIKTTNTYTISLNEYDHKTHTVTPRGLVDEVESYLLSDGTRFTIERKVKRMTYYDYELQLNEQKRSIKVIRQDFVPNIEQELTRLMRQ